MANKDPEKRRAYYLAHRDELKASRQVYNLAHRDEIRAKNQAYYQAHQEKLRAYGRDYHQTHREQQNAYGRAYHQAHREERRIFSRSSRPSLKLEVFNAYGGGRCACCGETHMEFLSLDHIRGDGALHRRQLGGSGGMALYREIKKQGYPPAFRVLCMNRNFALGQFGYCPHGNVRVEPELAIRNGHNSQQLYLLE